MNCEKCGDDINSHGIQRGCSICDCPDSRASVELANAKALLAAAERVIDELETLYNAEEYRLGGYLSWSIGGILKAYRALTGAGANDRNRLTNGAKDGG